ncbi:prepilin-type N-terminal cleavage/methylation domain-containing protein [bacterium]|nr:prepilin-type N-terminal cleavage/methylation domain-containing protein [bacterium]
MTESCKAEDGRGAFTLIELLIVVAIISILAAIAVPNFLEAQVRSKISRTKADMRTLIVALELYHVDEKVYPVRRNTLETATLKPHLPQYNMRMRQLAALTTPIAYLTSLPRDLFDINVAYPNNLIDYYDPTQVSWLINYRHSYNKARQVTPEQAGWMVVSVGPDNWIGAFVDHNAVGDEPATPFELRGTVIMPYDPTNGTISVGNIWAGQFGGMDNAGNVLYERAL